MKAIELTSFVTDLPIKVDVEEINTYNSCRLGTIIEFKDMGVSIVHEDFDTVDARIKEATNG